MKLDTSLCFVWLVVKVRYVCEGRGDEKMQCESILKKKKTTKYVRPSCPRINTNEKASFHFFQSGDAAYFRDF